MQIAMYSKRFWDEYDDAAEWCAKRGIAGNAGDEIPPFLSLEVAYEINSSPEEFQQRIRDTAYALAMEKNHG